MVWVVTFGTIASGVTDRVKESFKTAKRLRCTQKEQIPQT